MTGIVFKKTIDLTQPSTTNDAPDVPDAPQSMDELVEQLKLQREALDEKRDVHSIDVDQIKADMASVCRWARSTHNSKDVWAQACNRFPDLTKRYPSLVKMAISHGNTGSFHEDLDAMFQAIVSVQRGTCSVKSCSDTFEQHLQTKYYHDESSIHDEL